MLLYVFLSFTLATLLVYCFLLSGLKTLTKNKQGFDQNGKRTIRKRVIKRLFPFPILDRLYTLYLLRKYNVNDVDRWTDKLEQNDIYRISFGHISILFSKDATLSHKLFNAGHLSRPEVIYGRLFIDILENGVFGSPVEIWTRQRKTVARGFASHTYPSQSEIMNKHSNNLAQELLKLSSEADGGVISGERMIECIKVNTSRIVLEFIMGEEIGNFEEALRCARNIQELKEIVSYKLIRAEYFFPFLWWFHPKRKRLNEIIRSVHGFMETAIDHYKSNGNLEQSLSKDFVSRCLVDEMLKYGASEEEIKSQIATFLIATRCRAEVDALMDECNEDLRMNDLYKLEYLNRFIMESLRMNPPVPFLARKLLTPLEIDEGCTIGKGNIVAVCPWIIHHNPEYYPQPEIFDPDRFLPEEVKKREPGTFIAFSGGLRNCVGQRFAMLQLKSLLAYILRHFEVLTKDGLHDVDFGYELTLAPKREYRTSLKRRNMPCEHENN